MQLVNLIRHMRFKKCMWMVNAHTEEVYYVNPIESETTFQENILYISYITNFIFMNHKMKLNFILINDVGKPIEKDNFIDHFPNSNIVVVEPDNLFQKDSFKRNSTQENLLDNDLIYVVVKKAIEVMMLEAKYNNRIIKLIETFNAGKGLQGIVDMAYSLTQCPIVVMDTSYKILAMYSDFSADTGVDLSEQRKLGYITEKNLKRMKRDKIYEKMREKKYPFYDKAHDDKYGWLNTLVYLQGVEIAQIGMMEYSHKFTEFDVEFLDFFRLVVSWELQKKEQFKNKNGIMHSVLLLELLEDKIGSLEIADFRQRQLGWNISDFMRILIIVPFDGKDVDADFERKCEILAFQIQYILPNCRWAIYRSALVVLVISNKNSLTSFLPDSVISEHIYANDFVAFLSDEFPSLLDIKKNYEQTLAISNFRFLKKKEKSIYFYSDYIFYHIAQIISENNDLKSFFHPAIFHMKKYDSENHTHYVETLNQYLLYVDNPVLCSNNLFIHKNTFFYRMNKIRSLFNIDLNNGLERLKLQLSLEFLKFEESKIANQE